MFEGRAVVMVPGGMRGGISLVQRSMEPQRRTGSSRAWSEENAPGKQEKRKRETKTKRGVPVGNDKKELQWGRKRGRRLWDRRGR